MFNLTHDEDSSLDLQAVWHEDQCSLRLIVNRDHQPDQVLQFDLCAQDLQRLISFLDHTLQDQ